MTTVTINPADIQYEPTVADKIQRVLYRLDQGESLSYGMLYNGVNFCVLGIFADESGLGHWNDCCRYEIDNDAGPLTALSDAVRDHYNLTSSNAIFTVNNLPVKLYDALIKYMPDLNERYVICLSEINDTFVDNNEPNTNLLLADLIRSGVIFKEFYDDHNSISNSIPC